MRAVTAELALEAPRALHVGFRIACDRSALRIAASDARLDPERLWAHTCGELFAAPADGEAYVEWNFSPSGQVACFHFSAYRQRVAATARSPGARSSAVVHAGAVEIGAVASLPPALGDSLRLSLTMVIEDAAGALSYWALEHPAEAPDFHHRGGFALSLTLGAAPAIVGP